MVMGGPRPPTTVFALLVACAVLTAGCLDGPSDPAPGADTDPPLGPLTRFVASDGSAPVWSSFQDVDPTGTWIVLRTSSANMGFTRPGDCGGHGEAAEHGLGCRIQYLAALNGSDYGPVGGRDEVDEHDRFVSAAVSTGGRVVVFSTVQDMMDPRDQDSSDDAFAWTKARNETVWLSAPVVQGEAVRNDRCRSFCGHVSVTPDGMWAIFTSKASDLVTDDDNGAHDVFLTRTDGTTSPVLVSATPSGRTGNGESWTRTSQAISEDGRLVVFMSRATDLVSPAVGGDSETQVYVRDLVQGTTLVLGPFEGDAGTPAMDPTGRWVALPAPPQPGDPGTGAKRVIHLISLEDGERRVISVPTGAEVTGTTVLAPSISRDGAYVTFNSDARLVPDDVDDLHDVYVWIRATNSIALVSDPRLPDALEGHAQSAVIAEDALRIVFRWEDRIDAEPPWDKLAHVVFRDISI